MYRAYLTRSIHAPFTFSLRFMDLGILAALAMLAVWAFATFTTEATGWVHALLTVGVFLLIWRIVVRATPAPRDAGSAQSSQPSQKGTTRKP